MQPMVRLYSVPHDAFDAGEEEEELVIHEHDDEE